MRSTQHLPDLRHVADMLHRQVKAAIDVELAKLAPGDYLAVKVDPPPVDSTTYTVTLRTCPLGQPAEGERWPRLPPELEREGEWTIYYRLLGT